MRISIRLRETRTVSALSPYDCGRQEIETSSREAIALDADDDGNVALSADELRRVSRLLRALSGGE